jgi:hypothetical protein
MLHSKFSVLKYSQLGPVFHAEHILAATRKEDEQAKKLSQVQPSYEVDEFYEGL